MRSFVRVRTLGQLGADGSTATLDYPGFWWNANAESDAAIIQQDYQDALQAAQAQAAASAGTGAGASSKPAEKSLFQQIEAALQKNEGLVWTIAGVSLALVLLKGAARR